MYACHISFITNILIVVQGENQLPSPSFSTEKHKTFYLLDGYNYYYNMYSFSPLIFISPLFLGAIKCSVDCCSHSGSNHILEVIITHVI